MKVLLPSHGIFGQKSVKLRIPTFGDLHEMQSYNPDPIMRKYHFVELLSDVDFTKVTAMDVEYLYMLATFSLIFNTARYSCTCAKCGEKLTKNVKLTELDIIEIPISKDKLPYHKRVKGIKYLYNILTAQQVLDAYDWAQYEDNSETAFEDAQVAFIMGKELSDIEWVRKLPISVYLSAFLFQKIHYHGLSCKSSVQCFKCGQVNNFTFSIGTKIIDYDVDRMMSKFASVCDSISFEDFMKMSIVDFNSFVSALNNRLNG